MRSTGVWMGIAAFSLLAGAPLAQPSHPSLSAMDYIQIRQLVARYAYALDSGADNGYQYADLFTADGEFASPPARGREQLAALARGGVRGPQNTVHYMMNLVLEPSPDGAVGRQYLIELGFDDDIPNVAGKSPWDLLGQKRGEVMKIGGHYEDVYVKTQAGWRFKRREFMPSRSGPASASGHASPPQPRPFSVRTEPGDDATAPSGALSAWDYMQIEQLVASYGHALDSGFGTSDNGDAYAGLYTRDGLAFNRTKGYDALAAIARVEPQGPKYVRHYLTNHVIDPSPEGATGKAYLVVLDIGEHDKPSSIYLGGHYEDTYVRTSVGWRIKTRNLLPPRHGSQPPAASR